MSKLKLKWSVFWFVMAAVNTLFVISDWSNGRLGWTVFGLITVGVSIYNGELALIREQKLDKSTKRE